MEFFLFLSCELLVFEIINDMGKQPTERWLCKVLWEDQVLFNVGRTLGDFHNPFVLEG